MKNKCPKTLIEALDEIASQLDADAFKVARYHIWDAANAISATAQETCQQNVPSCGICIKEKSSLLH